MSPPFFLLSYNIHTPEMNDTSEKKEMLRYGVGCSLKGLIEYGIKNVCCFNTTCQPLRNLNLPGRDV